MIEVLKWKDGAAYITEQKSNYRNPKSLLRTYEHSMSSYASRDFPSVNLPPNMYISKQLPSQRATFSDTITHMTWAEELVTSEPGQSRSYGDWPSNAVITANLKIRAFDKEKLHQLLIPGQLMFVKRVMPEGGVSYNKAELAMNFQQFNTLLRRSYTMFVSSVSSKYFRSEIRNGSDSQQQQQMSSLHASLLHLFKEPEPCWSILLKNDAVLNSDEDFKLMRYLYSLGIISSWNLFGVMAVAPNNFFDTYEQRQDELMPDTTVYVKKDLEVEDIWGKQANSGSWLFLVLMRMKNKDGSYGPFQLRPFASTRKNGLRDCDRMYSDWSGARQYGVAWRIGLVIDRKGVAPSDHDLDLMRGHTGSARDQYKASYNAPKLHISYKPKMIHSI